MPSLWLSMGCATVMTRDFEVLAAWMSSYRSNLFQSASDPRLIAPNALISFFRRKSGLVTSKKKHPGDLLIRGGGPRPDDLGVSSVNYRVCTGRLS